MMEVSKAAPATKNGSHLLKATQKYCACHTEKLLTRYETFSVICATPAIRNEVAQGLKPPKYERLRSVADAKVTSSEHTLDLQTPRARGEPLLRMWENTNPYDLLLFPMLVNLSLVDTH